MITAAEVAGWLGITVPDGAEPPDDVVQCTAAANAFVTDQCPRALRDVDPDTGAVTWHAQTKLAATMLAARLVRRRNSPAGIEAFTDTGPAYVSRYDADVALMLRLGGSAVPMVG